MGGIIIVGRWRVGAHGGYGCDRVTLVVVVQVCEEGVGRGLACGSSCGVCMVDLSRKTRREGCLDVPIDVRSVCVDWDDHEADPCVAGRGLSQLVQQLSRNVINRSSFRTARRGHLALSPSTAA